MALSLQQFFLLQSKTFPCIRNKDKKRQFSSWKPLWWQSLWQSWSVSRNKGISVLFTTRISTSMGVPPPATHNSFPMLHCALLHCCTNVQSVYFVRTGQSWQGKGNQSNSWHSQIVYIISLEQYIFRKKWAKFIEYILHIYIWFPLTLKKLLYFGMEEDNLPWSSQS